MKVLFSVSIAAISCPLLLSAQILRYDFNEGVGAAASSQGQVTDPLTLRDAGGNPTPALWGSPGSGTSASTGDRALDLTSAAGMGSGFTGSNATLSSLSPVLPLTQFTVTGWFRPAVEDLGRASLLSIQNGNYSLDIVGLDGGPFGARSRLLLLMDNGPMSPAQIWAESSFEPQWSTPNAWAFFAITYNSQQTLDNLAFYSGSITEISSLSRSWDVSSMALPLTGASVWLGANGLNTNPFDGYMDDLRLYGSALSPSQIEQIRLGAIPEPNVTAFLVCGLIMWFGKRRFDFILKSKIKGLRVAD